ncbi:MAG: phospho-N-acetylmuramoyl-pentapeptide-transferase, partial [Clostridia bacterium]|nr:phospho-N-acetylmuramoyl-pentapeptide-transferase [Clostridia bacterium]
GLAASVTTITAIAMTIIALLAGDSGVAWVMAAVAGGCLGFLLFNHYPAKVFMGDTGSLALGGALGAAAVLTHSELFLLVVGLIYVMEALSVIIQVFSFQVFHRRVFKMSPLHHHFELCNWTENKIVICFTGVTLIVSVVGILAFLLRVSGG